MEKILKSSIKLFNLGDYPRWSRNGLGSGDPHGLRRRLLRANWECVFEKAAEVGKAVKLDCYADRQDLSLEGLVTASRAALGSLWGRMLITS
jgi:hypothetical protein